MSLDRSLRLLTIDLDDTLIDADATGPARIADAMACAREILGPALSDALAAEVERAAQAADPITQGRLATILRQLELPEGDPRAAAIETAYNSRFLDLVQPFPYIVPSLRLLRARFHLAIVTNGPELLQRAKLERFGLQHEVDEVVISGAVGARKPEAAIFWEACRRLDVPPAAAAHVGDGLETDVAGALGAGMAAIWRRPRRYHGPEEPQPRPHLVIAEFRELPTLLLG